MTVVDVQTTTSTSNTDQLSEKGLRVMILTGFTHSPNGGISAQATMLVLVGPGIPQHHAATSETPAVRLVRRSRGFVAEPLTPVGPTRIGYMASGAYIAPMGFTDDWHEATGTYNPIPLHDRTETVDHYNALFD